MRISDWSSDVCSSDLPSPPPAPVRRAVAGCPPATLPSDAPSAAVPRFRPAWRAGAAAWSDRQSVVWGQSVSVRVDLGGRRRIQNTKSIARNGYINGLTYRATQPNDDMAQNNDQ